MEIWLSVLSVLQVILTAVDTVFTYYLLDHGYYEKNPVMNKLMNRFSPLTVSIGSICWIPIVNLLIFWGSTVEQFLFSLCIGNLMLVAVLIHNVIKSKKGN